MNVYWMYYKEGAAVCDSSSAMSRPPHLHVYSLCPPYRLPYSPLFSCQHLATSGGGSVRSTATPRMLKNNRNRRQSQAKAKAKAKTLLNNWRAQRLAFANAAQAEPEPYEGHSDSDSDSDWDQEPERPIEHPAARPVPRIVSIVRPETKDRQRQAAVRERPVVQPWEGPRTPRSNYSTPRVTTPSTLKSLLQSANARTPLGWTPLQSRSPVAKPAVLASKDAKLSTVAKFEPNRINPTRWLREFEAAAESNDLLEHEVVQAFKCKMPVALGDWSQVMSDKPYDMIRQEFLAYFASERASADIRDRVRQCSHRVGVRPSLFYYEMAAINDLGENTLSQDELWGKFIDNLQPTLRGWVRARFRSNSMPVAKALARIDVKAEELDLCSSLFGAELVPSTSTSTTTSSSTSSATTSTGRTTVALISGEIEQQDFSQGVFAIDNQGQLHRRQLSNPPQQGESHQRPAGRITGLKRPSADLLCFHCTKTGHFRRDCPLRLQALELQEKFRKRPRYAAQQGAGNNSGSQPVAVVTATAAASQAASPHAADLATTSQQQQQQQHPQSASPVLFVGASAIVDSDDGASLVMAIDNDAPQPALVNEWQPLRVRVRVNGRPICAIFDTGSGNTLISQSMQQSFGCAIERPYTGQQLRNASEGPMNVLGVTRFRMSLDDECTETAPGCGHRGDSEDSYLVEALVMTNLGPQLLLGVNTIHAIGGTLDLNTLTIKRRDGQSVRLLAGAPIDDRLSATCSVIQQGALAQAGVGPGLDHEHDSGLRANIPSTLVDGKRIEDVTDFASAHDNTDIRSNGFYDYERAMVLASREMNQQRTSSSDELTMTTTTRIDKAGGPHTNILALRDVAVCLVSALDHVTIPPQHEGHLRVRVENAPDGWCDGHILSDLNSDLKRNGFIRQESVVSIENGQANLAIVNLNESRECHIAPNTALAVCVVTSEITPIEDLHTTAAAGQPRLNRAINTTVDFESDLAKATSADASTLSEVEQRQLVELLQSRRGAFATDTLRVSQTHRTKHYIDTGSAAPIRSRPHRCTPTDRVIIDDMVKTLLENGQIEPSTSPWASPIILVTKSDGSKRLCIDYRRLNAVTVKQPTPMPRIDDTFDALAKGRIFSTLDLASGYWQVPMDPASRDKTAFVTPDNRTYSWAVMSFGLVNAPATFVNLMNDVLGECINKFCQCFVDDLIIYSSTLEEHLEHLRIVLDLIVEAGLQVKLAKCKFARTVLPFLGHLVSAGHIQPNPDKLRAIQEYPQPTDRAALLRFNGMANYYRRFISNFATIMKPLCELTSNEIKFDWHQEHEQAFRTIKYALTNAPVLALPDTTRPFIVKCDASGVGTGAVLTQLDDSGMEHLIACTSKALNSAERKYSTTEQECLAVIRALKEWRHYLLGSKFTIITDHQALQYLVHNRHVATGRLARWVLILSEFGTVDICYRKGATNFEADALSRAPLTVTENDDRSPRTDAADAAAETQQQDGAASMTTVDHEDKDDLTTQFSTVCAVTFEKPYESPEIDLSSEPAMKYTAEQQRLDRDLAGIIEYLESGVLPSDNERLAREIVREAQYATMAHGLLWRVSTTRLSNSRGELSRRLHVPVSMRDDILRAHHESPLAGHLGVTRTAHRINQRYYWPNLWSTVEKWIAGCRPCLERKMKRERTGPMIPIQSSYPFEIVQIDILGSLPMTPTGNCKILAIMDHFTKFAITVALPNEQEDTVARAIFSHLICVHGAPKKILTDRGAPFISQANQALCRDLGIANTFTSGYHPMTNGQVERFNRTLLAILSTTAGGDGDTNDTWDQGLGAATFAYNTSRQASTGESPFFLIFGRDPNLPVDRVFHTDELEKIVSPDDWRTQRVLELNATRQRVLEEARKASARQSRNFASKVRRSPETFSIGQAVWLYRPTNADGSSGKLSRKWHGPFRITRVATDNNTVYLKDAITGIDEPMAVNMDRIQPYIDVDGKDSDADKSLAAYQPVDQTSEPTSSSSSASRAIRTTRRAPVSKQQREADGNVYEVRSVIDERVRSDGTPEYLVRWLGYPKSVTTWVAHDNFHAFDRLQEFRNQRHNRRTSHRLAGRTTLNSKSTQP